jgi:hypothetical protein
MEVEIGRVMICEIPYQPIKRLSMMVHTSYPRYEGTVNRRVLV